MNTEKQKGLSLIEGLVIVGIIGLLGTLAAIALDSARERARDAKRLADVVRTQAALELYFNDKNSYPVVSESSALGQTATRCLSSSGFEARCDAASETVYMDPVPGTPEDGLQELVSCTDIASAYCYRGDEDTYRIEFELENENPEAGLVSGVNCATETEVTAGSCEAL